MTARKINIGVVGWNPHAQATVHAHRLAHLGDAKPNHVPLLSTPEPRDHDDAHESQTMNGRGLS